MWSTKTLTSGAAPTPQVRKKFVLGISQHSFLDFKRHLYAVNYVAKKREGVTVLFGGGKGGIKRGS